MTRTPRLFVLASIAVLTLAGPVAAAGPDGSLFAGYWTQFTEYWQGAFQKQNGIVMGVLGVGAVALFIITRGKWRK